MPKTEIKNMVSARVSAELAGHKLLEQVDDLVGSAHRNLAEAEDVMQLALDMADEDHPVKARLVKRMGLLRRHRELLDDLYGLLSDDLERDMQDRLYSMLYTTQFARTIEDLRMHTTTATGRFRGDQPNRSATPKPAVSTPGT